MNENENRMMRREETKEREISPEEGAKRKALESLAESLLQKRNIAIEHRASLGVEKRWYQDELTFDGLDHDPKTRMVDYATKEATLQRSQGPKRSKVIVNVIRGKCETSEGRFSDIQLPVDDRNWGLKVTPVPEIIKGMKDIRQAAVMQTGQPLTKEDGKPLMMADVAKGDLDAIKESMIAMEEEIDDQLTECSFNGECRKVVRDAVRLGTGILKGPTVVKKLKKVWIPYSDGQEIEYVQKVVEDHKPSSRRVDPWNVYPDPDCRENITRAAYIWEKEEILPRELRSLFGVESYFEDQIKEILAEEPKRTSVGVDRHGKYGVQQIVGDKGATYEKWEYHGDLAREDIEGLGYVDVGTLSACVVFVNDRPIKVILNTFDDDTLPYDFFQWTTISNSPWGIGIPRIALWQQRCLVAAWRAMMDNAGDSSGANVIVGSGIEPDDGKWELTGKKIWRATGEVEDVGKAFAQFQLGNNQQELQNIIELSLRFIDMETSLPMMFQGEKGDLPETLGATNIMVDANNVALRARVKTWDDQITRPHIQRYYNWNMQYNEKGDIKGDYGVDVRGTSVLLEKDQQAISLIQIMEMKEDPDLKELVDWKKAMKQLFAARHLDILKSEDDIAAGEREEKEERVDPQIQGNLQVAQVKVQGELEKAKMSHAAMMEELGLKRDALVAEIQEKARMQREEMAHEREIKMIDFQIKQMEFSSKSGISLDKIKAELAMDASKINLQRELAKGDGKAEQVLEPPSEPAPRAAPGRAFPD